jgi:cell wall-associated NlpC family hydrolase
MRSKKHSIVAVLLLTMSVMMITPAVPASAASLADLLPLASSDKSGSSGGGLLDILLGLLMGKLFGNVTNAGSFDIGKVLGASSSPAGTSSNAIIATAQKYMGVPYVWGGATTSGFDCSGFTQYVMKQNGITIPRTAAEQFAAGTPVDKAQLKVGDLVFFTTYKPGASHVGFYMGEGKFIHASSAAEQVTISELADEYYTSHYVGARRYQ